MNELNSMVKESRVEYGGVSLDIRHIANHYYAPLLLSHDERIGYIQHIIRHPSEVRFVEDLERYVGEGDNRFGEFDWWLFSKLDEALDQVHIPYYDPQSNAMRRFNPDFVFWLQKGRDYHIVFVDPKGMQQSGYQHKVDGYRALFCDARGNPRPLAYGDLRVWTHLFLYTADANQAPQGYRGYWFDNPGEFVERLCGRMG